MSFNICNGRLFAGVVQSNSSKRGNVSQQRSDVQPSSGHGSFGNGFLIWLPSSHPLLSKFDDLHVCPLHAKVQKAAATTATAKLYMTKKCRGGKVARGGVGERPGGGSRGGRDVIRAC